MSADPISQREFDTYVKVTSKAIQAIQRQGQQTLDLLKELVINNNHKHDDTAKEIKEIKIDIVNLKEKAKAGSNIDKFWLTIGKYLIYVLIGALTVIGGYYGKELVSPQKQEVKKVIAQ